MLDQEKVRVIVAEDDYFVWETISFALEEIGYELIATARDGEEAIKIAEKTAADVILMDIEMPKLDGLEAAKAIQDKCPIPIVVLTAYESAELVEKASKVGVSAYLTKPPNPKRIERAITIAMARHNDLMALRQSNAKLERALEEIKTLQGILPMCSYCKDIRNDEGFWECVETYLSKHSDALLSHTLCPKCLKKHYPEFLDKK